MLSRAARRFWRVRSNLGLSCDTSFHRLWNKFNLEHTANRISISLERCHGRRMLSCAFKP